MLMLIATCSFAGVVDSQELPVHAIAASIIVLLMQPSSCEN